MPSYSWKTFVQLLSKQSDISFELKSVQLSQAILESGRGTSVLFREYGNPHGMKYRQEMQPLASPVKVAVSDGVDVYCCFPSEAIAVQAYWKFLSRPVYMGWQKKSGTTEGFLRFLLDCGYVGDDKKLQQQYFLQIIKLLPEASHILQVI